MKTLSFCASVIDVERQMTRPTTNALVSSLAFIVLFLLLVSYLSPVMYKTYSPDTLQPCPTFEWEYHAAKRLRKYVTRVAKPYAFPTENE
jgi:hypothetical protein